MLKSLSTLETTGVPSLRLRSRIFQDLNSPRSLSPNDGWHVIYRGMNLYHLWVNIRSSTPSSFEHDEKESLVSLLKWPSAERHNTSVMTEMERTCRSLRKQCFLKRKQEFWANKEGNVDFNGGPELALHSIKRNHEKVRHKTLLSKLQITLHLYK